MRNRRSTNRDAETTDLFSSSLIFGNVGGGPASTQQQSSSTSSLSSGAPYLLDGSGGSRRSPGGSLKSPHQQQYEQHPTGNGTGTGGRPVRNNRPPITSLLERQSRGVSGMDRMEYDTNTHRSPHPNHNASTMDRTHMSMSVANTTFQDPYGDISFASDGTGTGFGNFNNFSNNFSGNFSSGFNVDSTVKKGGPGSRMQTPYSRKGRFGYEEDDDERDRSVNTSGAATPLWGREGISILSSGGRSGDYNSYNNNNNNNNNNSTNNRENRSTGVGAYSSSGVRDMYGTENVQYGQNNQMMLGTGGNNFENNHREAFDQLEASWLQWVVVSGVPLESTASGSGSVSKVLRRMQQFGDILEHTVSNGNWMYLKFATPFQAERAGAESVTFLGTGLDSHIMLSVTRLTSTLARTLSLEMDSNGSVTLERRGGGVGGGVLGVTSPFPSTRHVERESRPEGGSTSSVLLRGNLSTVDAVAADQYLRPPKKRTGSICTRLMEYIFSY